MSKSVAPHKSGILKDAVQNAQVLLAYLAENGIDAEDQHVDTIIKSKHIDNDDAWTPELETQFWLAYKAVSKVIQPVTIDSLLATKEKDILVPNAWDKFFKRTKQPASSRRAVRTYTSLALLSMAFLLVLHIYAVIGTSLLRSIEQTNKRMADIEQELSNLSLISKAENRRTSVQIGTLQSELGQLEHEKNSSIELLANWQKLHIFGKHEKQLQEVNQVEGPEFGPPSERDYINRISIIQEAKNMHLTLSVYILPLLYGLLGGFVYVLRSLTTEIREMVYSKISGIKFALRINLGALAGLVVSLFIGDVDTASITFIKSLTPLSIAFLAGYSVEFLFTLLDNLIASITRTKPDQNIKEKEKQTAKENK